MKNKIAEAIVLRKKDKLIESNQLLLQLYKDYPEDSYLNYQIAWSFDTLGEESAAVPYYEKAIAGNLTSKDLQNAYLGLGSTLRTLGRYKDSEIILRKGMSLFPENNGLKSFYAMTLYNLNQHQKAMEVLLTLLGTTSSDRHINDYKKAILFYADKLDDIWS